MPDTTKMRIGFHLVAHSAKPAFRTRSNTALNVIQNAGGDVLTASYSSERTTHNLGILFQVPERVFAQTMTDLGHITDTGEIDSPASPESPAPVESSAAPSE